MKVVCMCPLGRPVTGQVLISEEVVNYLRDAGCLVRVINKKAPAGWRKGWRYLVSLLQIFRLLLSRSPPSLAYVTCSRSRSGFLRDALFIAACHLRKVTTINHVHGSDVAGLLADPLIGRSARALLTRCAANIVVAPLMAAECSRAGVQNTTVIQNFCAGECFDASPSRVQGAAGGTRVLYVSNIMASKGIFDLIEACERLVRKGFQLELHVVGRVLERTAALERRTAARFDDSLKRHRFMTWHGALYGADKVRAYQSADIYCLPSHNEAAPIALLEAMAVGLPVIATRVGSIPELVADGESGLLVSPGQPQELADGIARLVASPALRARTAASARQHALRHFTVSRFRENLASVIASAMSGQPAA